MEQNPLEQPSLPCKENSVERDSEESNNSHVFLPIRVFPCIFDRGTRRLKEQARKFPADRKKKTLVN